MATLTTLERKLSYSFKDKGLLKRALTHRSYKGAQNNERLEFLGDSILSFVIADALYHLMDKHSEGDLTRVRSSLVRQETLVLIAHDLNLSDFLILGEGELKSGGFRRASILADAVEAIFGAIFLDSNDISVAQQVIRQLFEPYLKDIDFNTAGKDKKTLLQELTQTHFQGELPVYQVVNNYGSQHDQTFEVSCEIKNLNLRTMGMGTSRRLAEQDAAGKAYEQTMLALRDQQTKKSIRKAKQLTLPVAINQRES